VTVFAAPAPRLSSYPGGSYELADDALAWLAEVVGFELDEWQRFVLRESLAESRPGTWAATEVALVLPRQNGKGAVLEARELVGLFLLREPLLIHSAHQFKTAQEHFLRLTARIEDVPELHRRVAAIRTGAGEQGVVLRSKERLRILARKGGSGRGFSAPFVALDEAMDLPEGTVGDMIPTQSAMPRRQRWYAGSAVDQFEQPNGVVFARVRERGIRGDGGRLAFFEWSLDCDSPDELDEETMRDDDAIAAANPGYGIRISRDAVEEELASLAARTVAVERFGVGDWPTTAPGAEPVISLELWHELVDPQSVLLDPVCFAYDVTPDRSRASIAAAGRRDDGLLHVEVIQSRAGAGWVPGWLRLRYERHDPVAVLADAAGPAGSLIYQCAQEGFDVEVVSAADHAKACGHLFDLVVEQRLRHLGSDELEQALRGATRRPLGDAWAWSRRNSAVDISPLVAATLALWGAATLGWNPNEDPVIH
jgi:hypothetical protein